MLASELLVARFTLGYIFLMSSLSKLSSSATFKDDIMEYQLLSAKQARLVARILPKIELVLGVSWIIGLGLPIASSLAIMLLLIFTLAIILNLVRGRRFSCHCFGRSSSIIGPAMIIRNIFLITLATFITLQPLSIFSVNSTFTLWQTDIQLLTHLNNLAPTAASILIALSIIFLLSEADSILA